MLQDLVDLIQVSSPINVVINPICKIIIVVERVFSHMTKRFAGVVLREGKKGTEGEENEAVEHESEEEIQTVKSSLNTCQAVLEGFTYSGYSWDSVVVDPESSATVLIDKKEVENNFYTTSDLMEVNNAYQGNQTRQKMKELEKGKLILKEIRLKNKHEDRRSHMITFVRCNKSLSTCCSSCRQRKSRVPRTIMDQLPPRASGAQFFVPKIDPSVDDRGRHFKTFSQQLEFIKLHRKELASGKMKLEPDSDLITEVDRCQVNLLVFSQKKGFNTTFDRRRIV